MKTGLNTPCERDLSGRRCRLATARERMKVTEVFPTVLQAAETSPPSSLVMRGTGACFVPGVSQPTVGNWFLHSDYTVTWILPSCLRPSLQGPVLKHVAWALRG